MTSKQRASLRSMANGLDTILYVGINGVTDAIVHDASAALEARELIKCCVTQGADITAKEACADLCEKLGAEPIQCIGRRFVMYRPSEKDPRIVLE